MKSQGYGLTATCFLVLKREWGSESRYLSILEVSIMIHSPTPQDPERSGSLACLEGFLAGDNYCVTGST